MQESEFNMVMDMSKLHLPPQGVMIIWEWEWHDDTCDDQVEVDDDIDHVSETSSEGLGALNPEIDSDVTDDDVTDDGSTEEKSITHTVTFKCIGTTHHPNAQEVLEKVSLLLDKGVNVPVDIFPEADNPHDNQAIAFKCYLDGNWHRIGYVVREALNSVHSARNAGIITAVSFAWAKFLMTWGPGYYAGICITIMGQWPRGVCQCASTR